MDVPEIGRPPSFGPEEWEALKRRTRSILWERGTLGIGINYGELARRLDLHPFAGNFFSLLDAVCLDVVALGGPMVTALVINIDTKLQGGRFFSLAEDIGFEVLDSMELAHAEQQRSIAWIRTHPESPGPEIAAPH